MMVIKRQVSYYMYLQMFAQVVVYLIYQVRSMFKERQVSYSNVNKDEIIQGVGQLGKNDIIWEQAGMIGIPPDHNVAMLSSESIYL